MQVPVPLHRFIKQAFVLLHSHSSQKMFFAINDEKLATELYRNTKGFTWQCDATNRIYLKFSDLSISFRVNDFFTFRRKVNSVNILAMLLDTSDACDSELIESPQNNISRRLTLCEIIQLRELLDGTKFTLDLNSVLHELLGETAVA